MNRERHRTLLGCEARLIGLDAPSPYTMYIVACTRARERLLVTAVAPGSELLGDLQSNAVGLA